VTAAGRGRAARGGRRRRIARLLLAGALFGWAALPAGPG